MCAKGVAVAAENNERNVSIHVCSAVLQRLHAAGELSSSAAEVQRILAVPLPDISPALKAMVGYGSAVTLRMALEAQLVAAALDAPPPRGAAAEAKAAELTVRSLS